MMIVKTHTDTPLSQDTRDCEPAWTRISRVPTIILLLLYATPLCLRLAWSCCGTVDALVHSGAEPTCVGRVGCCFPRFGSILRTQQQRYTSLSQDNGNRSRPRRFAAGEPHEWAEDARERPYKCSSTLIVGSLPSFVPGRWSRAAL